MKPRLTARAREVHLLLTKEFGATFAGHTGSGHLRYRLPNGRAVTSGATPSDVRAVRNVKARAARLADLPSR